MKSFRSIRNDTPFPAQKYQINVGFTFLEQQLQSMSEGHSLELDPDFQRAHVWSEAQQSSYVEYLMQGGPSARVIYWACEGWNSSSEEGPMAKQASGSSASLGPERRRRPTRNEVRPSLTNTASQREWF